MSDLADSLNDSDPSMVSIHARTMIDEINSTAGDVTSLADMAEKSRKELDSSSTSIKRAALNLNSLNLSSSDDRIYRDMFGRRFRMDAKTLDSLLGMGLGYGDIITIDTAALARGDDVVKLAEKYNASRQTLENFLEVEKPVAKDNNEDRGLGILMSLADMDLKTLNRQGAGIRLEPPADFDPANPAVTSMENIKADTDLSTAFDSVVKNQPDAAIEAIRKRGEQKPAISESHKLLGLAYNQKDMYDEALQEFKNASKKSPADEQAHFLCANAYQELERYDDALNEYKSASKINPGSGAAHLGAAYSLAMSGQPVEAENEFHEAISAGTDNAAAERDLAIFLYSQVRFYEAMEHFQASLKANPDQPKIVQVVAGLK
jgi:tetratricopeptide (TPR) repeat protein